MLICSALASGCSSASSSNGPLELGGQPGQICVLEPEGADATVGEVVTNTGDSELTVREVSLVDPDSLTLVEVYAIPLSEGGSSIGSGSTNPTDSRQKALWDSKRKVSSVVLDPGKSANIVGVLSLEEGKSEGSATAMKVIYSTDGKEHSAISSTEVLLKRSRC